MLGIVKPHKPVKACTVARWLKEMITRSGIDTELFKAHSVRGAATSKVAKAGLSAQQIMQRANWARVSPFKRYYKREIQKFQDIVMEL